MKLRQLLEIDDARKSRSSDIKVLLEWNKVVVYNPNFIKKFWRIITGRTSKIVHNLLRFKVINSTNNSEYTVYLEVEPGKSFRKILDSRIKIFCSCSDFKFRAAYTLNQEDNLFRSDLLDKHLGIALTTKPTKITTTPMCKHIYAVVGYVENNLNKLNLIN